jgi:hypothetical protein
VNQRALWVAIAVAVAIAGLVLYRGTAQEGSPGAQGAPSPAQAQPPPLSPEGRSSIAGSTATRPPAHVTRLASPQERSAVADRIAAARAARARQAPPRPPSLPGAAQDTSHDLERASPQLKAALAEAIPFLAECYKTAPITQRRPAVQMTLTGDPDVGTLIDAEELRDQDGSPLDPELDACLRTTLGSLELPPLDMAAPLRLKYSFILDDD